MNEADKKFEQQAKKLFDESVESLDAATLSKLNRARQAALANLQKPERRWSVWMPAGGVAATVLLALFVMRGPANNDFPGAPASDFEILLSEDSIDMFEELEFYSWLDTLEDEMDNEVG